MLGENQSSRTLIKSCAYNRGKEIDCASLAKK